MSAFEKVLCLLSLVCFGMCLSLLVVAISLEWGSMFYLWCGLMIAWHGSFGFVGAYEFLRSNTRMEQEGER